MFRIFLKSFFIIEFKNKLFLFFILALGILISFLEILGIGLIFPVLETFIHDNISDSKIYNLISKIYVFENKKNFSIFLAYTIVIVYIFKNILLLLSKYLKDFLLFKIRNNLETSFFFKYLKKDLIFHKDTNSAKIISNLNSEISIFIKSILLGYLELVSSFALILFGLIVVSTFNLKITIYIILLIIFLYLVVVKSFSKKIKLLGIQRNFNQFLRTKLLQESFSSINEIKINFLEIATTNNFKKILYKLSKNKLYIYFASLLPQVLSEIIIVLIVFYLYLKTINNNVELMQYLPEIALFFLTFSRISPAANKFINYINNIKYATPVAEKLLKDIRSLQNINFNKKLKFKKKIIFNDLIVFDSINFGFKKNSLVLKNINFQINKNSIIGIKGLTGSGKTTLLNLLVGFYKPLSGKIFIDGKKTDLWKNKNWLNKIGYVPQNNFIFDDTILKNITLNNHNKNSDYDKSKLIEVLKIAQLTDFVKSQRNGLETIIGESGSRISGGQRQRIALARVLYQQKDIVILDEATNSLDKKTESIFIKNLQKLKYSKTIIIVSHDNNVLKASDKIFEIKNGRLKVIS